MWGKLAVSRYARCPPVQNEHFQTDVRMRGAGVDDTENVAHSGTTPGYVGVADFRCW